MADIESRSERVRQSTFLWGCVALCATLLLTVVGVMAHDVRWLLLLAWPCAIAAIWEFARTFWPKRKVIVSTTGAGAVVSGLLLLRLYSSLNPGTIVNRALIEFGGATFDVATPEGLYPVKGSFANTGTLVATESEGFVAALVMDKMLDRTTVSQIVDYFASILNASDKPPFSFGGLEIDPARGLFDHAIRFESIKSPADLRKIPENIFFVDQRTRQLIESGSKLLYIFYVLRWEDGAIPGFWQIKGCSIYDGRQVEYVRYCYETHIEAIYRNRRS